MPAISICPPFCLLATCINRWHAEDKEEGCKHIAKGLKCKNISIVMIHEYIDTYILIKVISNINIYRLSNFRLCLECE